MKHQSTTGTLTLYGKKGNRLMSCEYASLAHRNAMIAFFLKNYKTVAYVSYTPDISERQMEKIELPEKTKAA